MGQEARNLINELGALVARLAHNFVSMKRKKYYSWFAFERDIRKLASQIKAQAADLSKLKIYGIPRGGLVVATRLSHLLDVPMITDEKKIRSAKNTLIVDDISDTGKTFMLLARRLRKRGIKVSASDHLVTLHWHRQSPQPLLFRRLKGDRWLVYPWETNNTSRYDRLS